jgi:biotin carboxyl carrier protein
VPDSRPEPSPTDASMGADPRTPEARAADHATIGRLTEHLLPALVAKLAATGLGEIELREGSWKVRLRRPADAGNQGRRAGDRPSRSQPGHTGHGHAPAALEGHRGSRSALPSHATNGTGPGAPVAVGPSAPTDGPERTRRRSDSDPYRTVATSPAVGIFSLAPGINAGTRVRSGDRLGAVDMLGVPQEVVAPADGIVGASLVENGETVEYGQELLVIELARAAAGGGA